MTWIPPASPARRSLPSGQRLWRVVVSNVVRTRVAAGLLAAVGVLAACGHRPGAGGPDAAPWPGRAFALIGDVPYRGLETRFEHLIADVNARPEIGFVLHTGDIKDGGERCDDDLLRRRFQLYQRFQTPFVFTPGDNEWTDCHRVSTGGYHPLERLAHLRRLFYPEVGRTTGGRAVAVRSQAHEPGFETYVENTLWRFGGAVMGTVHVVGSRNGLAPWDGIDPADSITRPRADRLAEVQAREAAALAWIDTVFDVAEREQAAGVLLAMQANPNFEQPPGHPERAGFEAVLARLAVRAAAFARPVVIAHGDSHYFRIDMPLNAPAADGSRQMLENLTRVENFGAQQVHWVEVTVDARDPNVFRFTPRIVEANRYAR